MKYLIFVADGMYDYPIDELGGKTPLQVAQTPHIDELVKKSVCGLLQTVPDGMPADSAVANLSIMGYDPRTHFTGRGVLEAANLGVTLGDSDIAFRCNFITVNDGAIESHSADNVRNAESAELVAALNDGLGMDGVDLYPGVSYRNLLVLRDGYSDAVVCSPPHDYLGKPADALLPKAQNEAAQPTEDVLRRLIKQSRSILDAHPVNRRRVAEGKRPANVAWPWSPGKKAPFATFKEKFGCSGAVISAVDLINGIGTYAGLDVITVEGATGLIDTNYEGKADAALAALDDHDFVYVHVEATDEAGHEGNRPDKIKGIEYFDRRLLGRFLEKNTHEVTFAVLADHYTPLALRTHVPDPVPYMVYNGVDADDTMVFDEEIRSKYSTVIDGDTFIRRLLGKA